MISERLTRRNLAQHGMLVQYLKSCSNLDYIYIAPMRQYQGDWAEYLPANLVDEHALVSLRLTNLFGLRLNFAQSGFLLYLLIAVILFALCWLGWRRNAALAPGP